MESNKKKNQNNSKQKKNEQSDLNGTSLSLELFRKKCEHFFEKAQYGIIIIEFETACIEDVNPAIVKNLGFSRETYKGKKIWELKSFQDFITDEASFFSYFGKSNAGKEEILVTNYLNEKIEVELEWLFFNSEEGAKLEINIHGFTDSKQLLEKIEQERNLLRTLIDSLPDVIYVKDKNSRKTIANIADVHHMGYEDEKQILGKDDYELYPKKLANGFFEDDSRVLKTGESILNREEFLLNPDGSKCWLLTTKLPLKNDKSEVIGLIGIGRDITELKRLEDSLKNERNFLRMLIDNLPDLIYLKDKDKKYVINNHAHLKSLGVGNQSEVTGKSCFDYHPPELAREYEADEERILQTGKAMINKEEVAFHGERSRKRWHLTSKIPLIDEDGNVTGIIGISRDITSQKKAEEKVLKLNRMYELQSSINQLIVRTTDIRILFNRICEIFVEIGKFNLAWIEVLDQETKSRITTAHYGATIDFLESLNMLYDSNSSENSPSGVVIETMEYFAVNDIETDSRTINLRNLAARVGIKSFCALPLIVSGNIYGIFFIYSDQKYFFDEKEMRLLDEMKEDVSFCIETILNEQKRKRNEEELLLAKRNAEEANRLKNSFLARMSHEFRTPLGAIIGSSNLIKEFYYEDSSDTIKRLFDSVDDGGSRLLSTITHIFDVARIESGDFKVDIQPLSLKKMIHFSHQSVIKDAERKKLNIELKLPDNEIIVLGDEYCIKEAIINVLQNAIKFSDKGTISVLVGTDEKYGVYSVIDDGVGMTEEYQQHLYELFSQEDVGYTRQFDGIGLGLALTKKYMDFMKGQIGVTSKKGTGTQVTLKIPLL